MLHRWIRQNVIDYSLRPRRSARVDDALRRWAYAQGAIGIVTQALLFSFYAVGEPFGIPLGDLSYLAWAGALLPIMLGLHPFALTQSSSFARVGLACGIAGALFAATAQALLVAKVIRFEENLPLLIVAFGLVGLWLVVINALLRRGGVLSARIAWFGIGIGLVWAFANVLLWVGGYPREIWTVAGPGEAIAMLNPLALVGLLGLFVANILQPFWSLWLGRTVARGAAA